ncbi:MAG: recombinase family protein [Erysipelotrichaceae bacterium]
MEKKICIYTRESTKRQAKDGYNLKEQQDKCKKYIEAIDLVGDVVVLEEFGKSAKTLDRPKMKQLIKMMKQGNVKTVVVYKLDRITRRLTGLSELLQLLDKYDVGLISVSESIDIKTATGRLLTNIICMLAEWEQDTISERTIDGLIGSANLGNYCKGGKVPFGYERFRKNKGYGLKIEKDKGTIVKNVFKLAIENYSCEKIALIINEYPYVKKMKKTFSDSWVRNILNNRIYLGIMKLQGQDYGITCSPIVTTEIYNKAHIMLRRRKKINVNEYLYQNKVMCSCGCLCVQQVTNKETYSGIKYHLYYYCNDCKQRISESKLNEYLIPKISNMNKKSFENDVLNEYREKVEMIEELKNNIYDLYLTKDISIDTYINLMKGYENDFKKVKEEYDSFLYNMETKFNRLSYDYKKKLINNKIEIVIVDMLLKLPIKIIMKETKKNPSKNY